MPINDYTIYIGLFIVGLVFGSFLNVVIIRIDDWKSIITGRSHCMSCKKQLVWYDLIPVVSYATLKGKCRYCAKPISHQYPLVEIVTGFLALAAYYLITMSGLSTVLSIFAFCFLFFAFCCMVVLFFHDVDSMLLPDSVSYVLIAASLLFAIVYYHSATSIIYGALIGAVPIALLVYPSRGKWMGEGDIKLALGLGILTAFPGSFAYMAMSFVLGGVYSIYLLATKQAKLKTAVPFAPFLIMGALIILFAGKYIINWYLGKLII